MNRFGTLLAWVNGLINSTALPAIVAFIANLFDDELEVAEKFVREVATNIVRELKDDVPGVALGAIISAAAANAAKAGVTVGVNALSVAGANILHELSGTVAATVVDSTSERQKAEAARNAAIAAANDAYDVQTSKLDSTEAEAKAKLIAAVTQ